MEGTVEVLLDSIFCLFLFILREVYHTKRMQHVICIKWSADNKYILSGSDEMNIRLWKANASEKLGVVSHSYCSLHILNNQQATLRCQCVILLWF